MPDPRRRGRQRESVRGPGGYFTDTQKTVVTICIGTLILAPGVSSCSSGPDCSVPFDRLTSATNAPFSMLVFFESTKRTNRVFLRAVSLYELFVKLIVVIVVVVVVVKYNPPVLVDVARIFDPVEPNRFVRGLGSTLSDSSETSHPFLPRLLCLYTRLLGGTSNSCHSLEGIISASSIVMLDRVEESSRLLDISLCLSSIILGINSSVRVPAASLASPIESAVCSDGRSTVDSKSNRIVDTVCKSFAIVVEHLFDAPLVDYRGAPALQIPLITVVRRRAAFALNVRANTQYRGFLVTVGVRGLFIFLVSLVFRVIVIVVISIVLLILLFLIFHVAVFISRLVFLLVFFFRATFGITLRFAVGHRSSTNGTRTFGDAVRLFGPRAISALVDHLNNLIRRIQHRLFGDRRINVFYDDSEETRSVFKVTLFRCHFFCVASSRVGIIFSRESRFVPAETLFVPGTILH
ncbi:hypothetical protein ALC60_12218 [Trachymyrmex zeteki]|uniref:Uncharacterized protein n=1 Tax=Mycetomoellerius zeteki TaxID=64791 RepID=A0A151WLF0_9HYME|nr:hypothetical protein ALC60_12218 [Trachymyrmex zeteki]